LVIPSQDDANTELDLLGGGMDTRPRVTMLMKRLFSVLVVVSCAYPASAATIVAAPIGARDTGAIVVSGTLKPGDDEVFSKHLMQFPKGLVVLQGDGGDLAAAIKIGTAIRLKNYSTLVPTGSSCASACAIAWLGGTPRILEDGSQLGFHAAYLLKDGQAAEAGAPNALLGAYLGKIGLPDRAVAYITSAPPEGMNWLSSDDAEKMGIDLKTMSSSGPPAMLSGSSGKTRSKREAQDRQLPEHPPAPPTRPHAAVNRNHYFVAWMTDTLRRLGIKQPSSQTAPRESLSRGH
jgi:hypothetical protein